VADDLADEIDGGPPEGTSRPALVALVVLITALVVFVAFAAGRIAGDDEEAGTASTRDSAVVERRSVAPSDTFDGEMTYSDEFLVVVRIAPPEEDAEEDAEPESAPFGGEPGAIATPTPEPRTTITDLPRSGDIVDPGDVIFERDGRPVILLPGVEPAFRTLTVDITDGPDVTQLERWLVDEGHDPDGTVSVDETFDEATAEVVANWQRSLGLEATGEVVVGDVVFAATALRVVGPSPPVEVAGERFVIVEGVSIGDSTPVVAVTSVDRQVSFEVALDDRGLVAVDGIVDVGLPDGTTVAGTITAVRPSEDDPGKFSVTVDVVGTDLPEVDQTPVTVTVTGATTSGLFVPAEAIVARDLRGYAVEVVAPSGHTEFVDVEIGVVAGRSVQVLSPALSAGTVVIAP
jgi:peptidoglycan hydrolase-like protein with peptidoglycan-binding domain